MYPWLLGLQRPAVALLCPQKDLIRQVVGTGYEIADRPSAHVVVFADPKWGRTQVGPKFVPRIRQDFQSLSHRYPSAAIYALVPESLDSVPASLVRQAAREAGVETIDPSHEMGSTPETRTILAVYDRVFAKDVVSHPWKLVGFSSQEVDEGPAAAAIDGDPETYWHTQYSGGSRKPPHELVVDTGSEQETGGFSYLPRQDGGTNGTASKVEFSWSTDGQTWSTPLVLKREPTSFRTSFPLAAPVRLRYFRFRILETASGPWGSAAEVGLLPTFMAGK